MTSHGTFATAINCIDGRAQKPVEEWLKSHYHADFVDMITEPGPDLAFCTGVAVAIEELKHKVEISVNAHHSHVVAAACHYDCAGNPVSANEHKKEIERASNIIKSWKLPVEVVALWINRKWEVERVV